MVLPRQVFTQDVCVCACACVYKTSLACQGPGSAGQAGTQAAVGIEDELM